MNFAIKKYGDPKLPNKVVFGFPILIVDKTHDTIFTYRLLDVF